jgi:hypothetical protein
MMDDNERGSQANVRINRDMEFAGHRCRNMKMLLIALTGFTLLTGCARSYVLTMSNGERIRTGSKPKLVKGFYYFKDASGHDAQPVFSGRVRELAPASMASPNPSSAFKPVSTK